MVTTLQRRTTKRSDAPEFLIAIFYSYSYLYNFFRKIVQETNIILFVVQFQRRKPHGELLHQTYKRPPWAERPPTTDRAERLTLVRGSHPTLPTASAAPFLLPLTSSRNYCGKSVCYGWLTLHNQLHTIIVGQIRAPPQPAGT